MPAAHGGRNKYAWMDHDPSFIEEAPPVQNTWYEVYHAYNVRQLLMALSQSNDETDDKGLEVKWTCDGNEYFQSLTAENSVQYYQQKDKYPSAGGTEGLATIGAATVTNIYRVKHALDFKVEIRITSVVGTNQVLRGWALYETLERTLY